MWCETSLSATWFGTLVVQITFMRISMKVICTFLDAESTLTRVRWRVRQRSRRAGGGCAGERRGRQRSRRQRGCAGRQRSRRGCAGEDGSGLDAGALARTAAVPTRARWRGRQRSRRGCAGEFGSGLDAGALARTERSRRGRARCRSRLMRAVCAMNKI